MWITFTVIVFIEVVLNFTRPNAKDCLLNQPDVLTTLILHHIANYFLLFGWTFNDTRILIFHFICCLSSVIYWMMNKHFCHVTVFVNEKCNWDKEEPFRDILYYSGIKSTKLWKEKRLHYVIISLLGLISLYKINKHLENNVISNLYNNLTYQPMIPDFTPLDI